MSSANRLRFCGAVAFGWMSALGGLQAQSMTPQKCRAEYRATIEGGGPSNTTWEQFRKTNCRSAAQVAPQTQPQTESAQEVGTEHFTQCMRDWDTATHMTKEEWSRACRRLVKSRLEFRLDQAK
jgi:hypothetical protein